MRRRHVALLAGAVAAVVAACSFVQSPPQDSSGALSKGDYAPPPDMSSSGPSTLNTQACFAEGTPCGAKGSKCCAGFICAGYRDPVCMRGT